VARFPAARWAAVVALALAAGVLGAAPALASGDYPSGALGADVSFPQCGRAVAIDSVGFGVVGVNGGRPYTMNRCLGAQYQWARGGGVAPSVYVNLEFGEAADGYQACRPGDHLCGAYNFGYNAAEYAFGNAYYATGGSSGGAAVWWLDVETMNEWSDHPEFNAQVVRGAVDYLQRSAGRKVGVYSTRGQWTQIVGGRYTPPGVGNWVAGASDLDDFSKCFRPFWAGAPVWLYQYLDDDRDLDINHSC